MRAPLASVLGCLWAGRARAQPDSRAEFESFVRRLGRRYGDEQERERRFRIFEENLAFIAAENAKGRGLELAVNRFADMTLEEFTQAHVGARRALPPQQPLDGLPYLGSHALSARPLPWEVDWRKQGATTPAKMQGTCSSCWSFSATGALEAAWKIATGKLVSLSEQQLIDCSTDQGNKGCKGGVMDWAFQYAQTAGLCTEESYPYKAEDGKCTPSNCSVAIPRGSVVGYKVVPSGSMQSLMDAVAQQPVSVDIQSITKDFQFYKSGVLSSPCGPRVDHGVLAVGYGTTGDDATPYWIIKNSFGPDWGMQGFAFLKRGLPGTGECGILTYSVYPVVQAKAVLDGAVKTDFGEKVDLEAANLGSPAPAGHQGAPLIPLTSSDAGRYEKPPCKADEKEYSVQGVSGKMCAPPCDDAPCPAAPGGSTALPLCVLEDADHVYCALTCQSSSACPTGTTCTDLGGSLNVCLYPGLATSELRLRAGGRQSAPSMTINV